ncbi:hypothetical protein BRC97_11555 [Halobacteriales archaeon QS_6_71_20]|nr:MAG: hypothetical protein BRC97_11555 [Halobacteriales archaeon QS_6_71_20]
MSAEVDADALTLRRWRPGDGAAVTAVFEAALRDAGALYPEAGSPAEEDPLADYVDAGGEFLVGVVDDAAAADVADAAAGDGDGDDGGNGDSDGDGDDDSDSPADAALPDELRVADGTLVATGAVRPPADPVRARFEGVAGLDDREPAELKRMHVYPAFHRRGIGGRLFDELIERARGAGYDALVLETTDRQEAALAFYRERGFAEATRRTVTVGDGDRLGVVSLWTRLG